MAVLGLAGGCADEQESLLVTRVIAWPDDGMCVADPANTASLPRGVLDVFYGTRYTAAIEVLNQLFPQNPMQSSSGTDSSEIQLTEVDVLLSTPQAPEIIDAVAERDVALVDFTTPISTNSLPGQGTAGVFVDVISQGTAVALRDQLVAQLPEGTTLLVLAELTVRGRRTGQPGRLGSIDARRFSFPIEICIGCLYSGCSICEEQDLACDPARVVMPICGNAQDGPVWNSCFDAGE